MADSMDKRLNFGSSRLWTPYRDLKSLLETTIHKKNYDFIPEFESILKNHKLYFISLLKNPEPNAASKNLVLKATKDGIMITGESTPRILNQTDVEEALLISNMLHLDELVSLELLIAGEQQLQYFPGLTQGLVAMLLYFDGRRNLCSCLKLLVQARRGRTWSLDLNPDLSRFINQYTDELQDQGIIGKIFDLLQNFDIAREMALLQENRAIGGPRYRKQIIDLIQESYEFLAETIFCFACQGCLKAEEVSRLLQFLGQTERLQAANGSLDSVALYLIMAFLYSIDTTSLKVLEPNDDRNRLSLLIHPNLVGSLYDTLTRPNTAWTVPGLRSIFLLGFGVAIGMLSQFAPNSLPSGFSNYLEADETCIDMAIQEKAFHNISSLVIESKTFHQEEFFIKQIHELITNLIVLMPSKIKELRANSDEVARIVLAHQQAGITPPTHLSRDLEDLFNLIAKLYYKQAFDLAQEYWCPLDAIHDHSYIKQVALFKFIRLSGDLLPSTLFVPYVRMLASLSNSQLAAHYCFTFLKANGHNSQESSSIISWDHFMGSLHQYYQTFKQDQPSIMGREYSMHPHLIRGITPQEVKSLEAVLKLISNIVSQDEIAGISLADNSDYRPLSIMMGMVTCSIPPELKAALFGCLEAFAKIPSLAFHVWQGMESSHILLTTNSGSSLSGLTMELEELEARNEEFPITRSMLSLLNSLLDSNLHCGLNLQPYLNFVCNNVLLRFHLRSYKNEAEKWEVCQLCLQVIYKLVNGKKSEESRVSACSILLSRLLYGSDLLHIILFILNQGIAVLEKYTTVPGQETFESCMLLSLQILVHTAQHQSAFLSCVRESGSGLLVRSLDQLLLGVNPITNNADYPSTLLKYVTYNSFYPHISMMAVRLLGLLSKSHKFTRHIWSLFSTDQKEKQIILHGFVEALEVDCVVPVDNIPEEEWTTAHIQTETSKGVLNLLLAYLKHPGPNFGHFLLGFRMQPPITRTVLQQPGNGNPRTCLHSVLSMLNSKSYELADLAYHLIYRLSTFKNTTKATLRYLHSCDFFCTHLQKLPFKKSDGTVDCNLLAQQSWFLKTVALEIKLSSENNQKSNLQRILNILIEPNLKGNILLSILWGFESPSQFPTFPKCELLEETQFKKRINECLKENQLVDIEKLRQNLNEEMSLVALTSHRTKVSTEIANVLNYVQENNAVRSSIMALNEAFTSWRYIMEVILNVCPLDLFGSQIRSRLFFDTTVELLDWLSKDEIPLGLVSQGTGTIVILMSTLSSQDKTLMNPDTGKSILLTITCKIMDLLIKTGGSLERIRVNIYTALLYILKPLFLTQNKDDKVYLEQLELILNYGSRFLDLVCRDACISHSVTRLLAMSMLDVMIWQDSSQKALLFMLNKGYLKHLVDSIEEDDQLLQKSSQHFYIFDSKLALFARIAQIPSGAQALLPLGVLSKLSDCSALHLLPQEPSFDGDSQDQLHLPCMQLGVALVSACGPNHRECLNQLGGFLTAHSEMMTGILKTNPSIISENKILLATSLLAYAASLSEPSSQLKLLQSKQTQLLNNMEKLKPEIVANLLHSCCPTGNSIISNKAPKFDLLISIVFHTLSQIQKEPKNEANNKLEILFYNLEKVLYLILHLLENRQKYSLVLTPQEILNYFPESFFARLNIPELALKKENSIFFEAVVRRLKNIVNIKVSSKVYL